MSKFYSHDIFVIIPHYTLPPGVNDDVDDDDVDDDDVDDDDDANNRDRATEVQTNFYFLTIFHHGHHKI